MSSLSHTFEKSNHTTQISCRVLKTKSAINKAKSHNERINTEKEKHIDQNLKHLNETLIGSKEHSAFVDLVARFMDKDPNDLSLVSMDKKDLVQSNGRKVRSDANIALEIEAHYPGDIIWCMMDKNDKIIPVPKNISINTKTVEQYNMFKQPKDKKEFEDWKESSIEFIKAKFGGEQNVLFAELHMDEEEPHIHAVVTPIVEKDGVKSFNKKEYLYGGNRSYEILQTEYADALSYLGYERGAYSSARYNYSKNDIKKTKVALAEELIPELSEDRAEAIEQYKAVYTQAKLSKDLAKRSNVNGTIKKQNKTIDEKNKYIDWLKDKLNEQTKELDFLKRENRRRQCELKGLEVYSDKDLVNNYYLPLQEQMINDGLEYYKKMGIDMNFENTENIEIPIEKDFEQSNDK